MSNVGSTVYPASLDTFDNPLTTTLQNQSGYSHAALHSQVHDAVEALESVLGTTAGTSVLKNFSAGQFAARVNSGGTIVQVLTGGTINSSVMGSPTITGGAHNNATLGTNNIVGGTINTVVIGTPTITGGAHNAGVLGTNQITGGTIALNTFNADGESDITITPGTAKTVRIRTPRQDITTNTYPANTVIQHGWTFTLSQNTTTSVAKTVTFPRAFTAVPSVVVTHIGYKDGSDPTAATDFTQNGGYFPEITVGTASFVVETFSTGGTLPSGRRCGVSWIAIGAS